MAFRASGLHTLVQSIRVLRDRGVSSTLQGPTKHVLKSRLQDLMTRILRMVLMKAETVPSSHSSVKLHIIEEDYTALAATL